MTPTDPTDPIKRRMRGLLPISSASSPDNTKDDASEAPGAADSSILHHELHVRRDQPSALSPEDMETARLIAFADRLVAAEIDIAIDDLRNELNRVNELHQQRDIDFRTVIETRRLVLLVNDKLYKACNYFRNMKPETLEVEDCQQELDDMLAALKTCNEIQEQWCWRYCTPKTREIANIFIELAEFAKSFRTPDKPHHDDSVTVENYRAYMKEKAKVKALYESRWWEQETPMGILFKVGFVPPLERFWICPKIEIMKAAETALERRVFTHEINKPDDVLDLINEANSRHSKGLEQIMEEAGCAELITSLKDERIEEIIGKLKGEKDS